MFPLRRLAQSCSGFVLFESFGSYGTESTARLRLFESLEGRQTVHVTEVYVTRVERFSPLRISITNNSFSYVYTLIQLAGVRLINKAVTNWNSSRKDRPKNLSFAWSRIENCIHDIVDITPSPPPLLSLNFQRNGVATILHLLTPISIYAC